MDDIQLPLRDFDGWLKHINFDALSPVARSRRKSNFSRFCSEGWELRKSTGKVFPYRANKRRFAGDFSLDPRGITH